MLDELAHEVRLATDVDARFRWIDRFAREWRRVVPRGYAASQIEQGAARLGVQLPTAVRRWYELFARTEGIACGQNRVVPPSEWRTVDGRLSIGIENQDNWQVLAALDRPDPLVFIDEAGAVASLTSAFSIHAVQTAIFESVMMGGRGGCNGPALPGATSWLAEHFGAPVVEPSPAPGSPRAFYIGRTGVVLHDTAPEHAWLTLVLVDDDTLLREVERSAPVAEWLVAPTDPWGDA